MKKQYSIPFYSFSQPGIHRKSSVAIPLTLCI